MNLIDQVKTVCDRLATLGWREFLKTATGGALDIQKSTPAALRTELTKSLATIDRSLAGLEDFASAGRQAITAGQPALSLLYHALASPLVVRDHQGSAFRGYATPKELDVLENLIFGLTPLDLSALIAANGGASKVAVVIFSSEYRPAATTVDGRHADLVFSRTGIARVGTARPRYAPESRGFWPEDEGNAHGIRVIPAKFAAWVAVKKKGAATRVPPIQDNDDGQEANEPTRDFWVPVHKLFPGTECLANSDLRVSYEAKLFNLKIQRVHVFLGTKPLPDTYPYVLRDEQIGALSGDADLGPGWLVPTVQRSLVVPAFVDSKPVTYRVTPDKVDAFATFDPSEGLPNGVLGVPEYVHGRTRVTDGKLEDLNDQPDVIAAMKQPKKGYDALHYVDFTGEGWITGSLAPAGGGAMKVVPAYALVAAPDFFPSSGQLELARWSRSTKVPLFFRGKLWHLPPTPLSETRMPANLQLPGKPFLASDDTITALVGMGDPVKVPSLWPVQRDARRSSSLPDDAAGVFAPGWDVSRDQFKGTDHLAGYGLGSPFPEDAKLCAALSTFWPAVAPDVFRTFVGVVGNTNGTIAPLTDEEIGQVGALPWDGIPGPKVVSDGGKKFVEAASFLNADYVRQAMENRFSIRLIAQVEIDEYKSRILAACRVYSVLSNVGNFEKERNNWLVLSFREVPIGDPALQAAQAQAGAVLQGKVTRPAFAGPWGSRSRRSMPAPSGFRWWMKPNSSPAPSP